MTDKEKNYLETLMKQSQVETSEGFAENVVRAVQRSQALQKQNPAPKRRYLLLILGIGLIVHFFGFRMLGSTFDMSTWFPQGALPTKVVFSLVLLFLLNASLKIATEMWSMSYGGQSKKLT